MDHRDGALAPGDMKKLILLDRDGVINVDRVDSVKSVAEFHFLPKVQESMARLKARGLKLAIITNQSIVGRGIISHKILDDIHTHMQSELKAHNAEADAIYFAPDHPDQATDRRKPGPGMVLEAMRDFSVESAACVMIGDALRDLEAAAGAGVDRILLRTGRGEETLQSGWSKTIDPVLVYKDLSHATDAILQNI
jgi:D-glycero-D-manno-heptose 1,7-bisphosphate phosphatase